MVTRKRRGSRARATVAASEEPSCPPPVVVAGGLSPFEGLSASLASRQRHVAATPGAPSTMVGRCDRPVPPAGSSRPAVAVVGSSPLDRSSMVRRLHRW